jgi:hypothetical protein
MTSSHGCVERTAAVGVWLFVMHLMASGGYLGHLLNCHAQTTFANNRYAQHALGFTFLYLTIVATGNYDSSDDAPLMRLGFAVLGGSRPDDGGSGRAVGLSLVHGLRAHGPDTLLGVADATRGRFHSAVGHRSTAASR